MWPKYSNKEHHSNEDESPNVTSLQPLPSQCCLPRLKAGNGEVRHWVLSRQHRQISKMFTTENDSQRERTGISTQAWSRPGTTFHPRMMDSINSRARASLPLHQLPQYQIHSLTPKGKGYLKIRAEGPAVECYLTSITAIIVNNRAAETIHKSPSRSGLLKLLYRGLGVEGGLERVT